MLMQYFRTLFDQYDFWCRGTLQEKLHVNSIFSHKQIVICFIKGDEPNKPGDESSKLGDKMAGDEMAWRRSDYNSMNLTKLIDNSD